MAKAVKIASQSDAENAADAKKDGTVVASPPCKTNSTKIPSQIPPAFAAHVLLPLQLLGLPSVDAVTASLKLQPKYMFPNPRRKKILSDIPQSQQLTKPMKEVGTAQLEEFHLAVWFDALDRTTDCGVFGGRKEMGVSQLVSKEVDPEDVEGVVLAKKEPPASYEHVVRTEPAPEQPIGGHFHTPPSKGCVRKVQQAGDVDTTEK
ncbi:hypothetical protein C8R44DRAFT_742067 [Mycena epipterygia]|nr:hypothetical protein C8R44DRAFT_742067 [Mycena epipterygia]